MPTRDNFCVSVLLLREGDVWVAQCLEYDIAAQGASINDAKAAFEKTFVGQILIDLKHEQRPFEGIGRAPRFYWDRFNEAERLADNRRPFYVPSSVPPAFMIQAAAEDIRIFA